VNLTLRIASSILLSLGLVFSAWLGTTAASGPARSRFLAYRTAIDWDLRFIRSGISADQTMLLQGLSSVALIAAAAGYGHWLALTLLPLVLFAPRGLASRARLNRVTLIEQQVDTWLVILANALRATPALGEAMEASARLSPAPLSEELDLALKEYHLGAPLDVALKTMSTRLKSRTLNVAIGTLRIARNTGGNLPETLEVSAAALREIARLEGVVRTKTAEGKAQAVVIAVVPFPLVGLLNWLNPQLLSPLWNTLEGYGIVAGAFLLWLLAILWTRKILSVDI